MSYTVGNKRHNKKPVWIMCPVEQWKVDRGKAQEYWMCSNELSRCSKGSRHWRRSGRPPKRTDSERLFDEWFVYQASWWRPFENWALAPLGTGHYLFRDSSGVANRTTNNNKACELIELRQMHPLPIDLCHPQWWRSYMRNATVINPYQDNAVSIFFLRWNAFQA